MPMPEPIKLGFNQPFYRAVEELKKRGIVLPDKYYGELQGLHRQLNFSIAGKASLDQLQGALDSLEKVMNEGQTFAKWQKDIRVQDLGLPKHRLDNIFRTNIQAAYNRGHWENFVEHKKTRPYLMYDAINDSRVRPTHLAMDGIIRPVGDSFWATNYPPNGFRCVLPWTKITGDFEIGLKSFYSGEAVEIITKSGKRFAVTANHPVLSNNGWVTAKSIKNGDHLLRHAGIENFEFSGIVDNQNPPTRADDVFNALASEAFGFADITSFKFHDDTHLREGKVYVAGFDSKLLNWVKPISLESVKQWNFKWTNNFFSTRKCSASSSSKWCAIVKKTILYHQSFNVGTRAIIFVRNLDNAFTSLIRRNYNSFKFIITRPRRNPSSTALPFNEFWRLLNCLPLKCLRFTPISSNDSSVTKPFFYCIAADVKSFCNRVFTFTRNISITNFLSINTNNWWNYASSSNFIGFFFGSSFNSFVNQQPFKQAITYSRIFEDFCNRFSSQVSIDEVVSVRNFFFRGHVYDFQCKNSVIVANGIITHNCRCRCISLNERQAQERSKNGQGLNKPISDEMKPDKGFDYNVGTDLTAGVDKAIAESKVNPVLKSVLEKKLADAPKIMTLEKLPTGLTEQDYLREFNEIANAPRTVEVIGKNMIVDERLFQNGRGELKITKRGREQYVRYFADTIFEADEIYETTEEFRTKKGEMLLKRRHLKTYADNGAEFYVIVAFTWSEEEKAFVGSTAFVPMNGKNEPDFIYFEKQKEGDKLK
jgi:SPP1 gp7 family putative phage head morphogenesis protein